MRYVCPATVVAFSIVASSVMFGQSLSITNYQFVSEQRVTRTQSNFTYRADLVNHGVALSSVTATLVSVVESVQAVAGKGTLNFAPVPANSQAPSSNTFTILVDRTVTFDFANLQWSFQTTAPPPPVANAGPNQTARLGVMVTLNGSGSTNPGGMGTLTYSWAFTSRPTGSAAALMNPSSVMPSFVPDITGNYNITLTVSNGVASGSASVTISTCCSPPVANAGPNQTVTVGSTVVLNGSGSSDLDGNPLTYSWTLPTRPAGSTAALTGASTVSPTFVVDKPGAYVAQLIVHDGAVDSPSASVTITTKNSPPVANPGSNQVVNVNASVQLNGSGSTDVDGDPLTYQWSLITAPGSSAAALNHPAAVNPAFTADRPGTYVAQLIVNDGQGNSAPATVTITTSDLQPPAANAGSSQTVARNSRVTLNGSGTDPQGLPLTFQWALITQPTGSIASLSSASVANPAFAADLPGTYVAQLVVNNGYLNSAPSTVMISTTSTPPVANAGPNQNVPSGATVKLDGSGSVDSYHDPLTYAWTFTTRPNGSTTTLAGPGAAAPSFVADVAGTYVVQLIVNDGFANSNPATVTIEAQALTLTPNPLNLTNASGTLTVVLSTAAGSGGQVVNLASSNSNVASLPANVTIAEATMAATVTVTLGSASGSTTITATAPGFLSTAATVNVAIPTLTVALDTPTVGLARSINGSITLSAPAPAGGVSISLSANPGGIVDVEPPSVTIAAGGSAGAFTVTGVAQGGPATITASAAGYNNGGAAEVNVVIFGAIGLPASATVGLGQSVDFPVRLSAAAPAGGVTVTLNSGDTSRVTVTPSSVFIAAGAKTPAVQPQLNGINMGSAAIGASSPSYTSASQQVQVNATLSFSPAATTITGTGTQNLALTLSASAPTGLTINLSSDNTGIATVPGTVTIPANSNSVNVPVKGVAQGSTSIHANAPNIGDIAASVTVVSEISLPANVTVAPGQSVNFPVSLATAAPQGGIFVALSSSDPSKVTVTPDNLFIPQGEKTPNAPPKVNGIDLGSATITASAFGFTAATQRVQVTATASFFPASVTITGTATGSLALTLSAPAPAGGVTLNVSSDNTGVATVPPTVTLAGGANSATVVVKGVATGSTVIRASGPGIAETTASVTVGIPGAIGVPASLTVGLGQAAAFPVGLGTAAPQGGVTVNLTSGDKVTVTPASVFIAAGATTPAAQPMVTGAGIGAATVTASAAGYVSGTGTVTVSAPAMSFAGDLTLTPGGSGNLTLNLTGGLAPAAGLPVNLSSSASGVAGVPATVTIPAGTATVTVPVSGVSAGQAAITASATGITSTQAKVNVNAIVAPSIGVPATSSVNLGQSTPFAVTLSQPAAAEMTVALSSNSGNVTVSPASVTISQGATQPATQPQVTGAGMGSATITASSSGFTSGSGAVTVPAPVMSFSGPVTLNAEAQGNLTLNLTGGQAPAGGLTINLKSDNTSAATVLATVDFPLGATSATVTVTAGAVQSMQTATITASASGLANATATVTVNPLGGILVSSPAVGLNQATALTVTLPVAAPAGGVTVALNSGDTTKVTVSPDSIAIAAGATTSDTQVQVTGVGAGTANITAAAPGYTSGSGTVTITPLAMSFSPAALSLASGSPGTLTLNLTGGQAPVGGLTVNLISDNTNAATVPVSVDIAGGATSATVTVASLQVQAAQTATITASATGLTSITAKVTVTPLPAITIAPVTVGLGLASNLQVTLAQAAPSALTITLTGDTKVSVSPTTITIAAGATAPATAPQVTGAGIGSGNITASATGYASGTGVVTVSAPTMTFSGTPLSITAGNAGNLTLNLTGGQAPAGGLKINLLSDKTGVATVPGSVTLDAGATSATVTVTGVGTGSATITASSPGILAATATANVTPIAISVASGTVGLGLSASLQVNLSSPASADVTVNLISDNPSRVTVSPASVTISKGATAPGTPPVVTGAGIGPAGITASAATGGYTSGSGTVTVTGPAMTFSPATLTVNAGAQATLTLNLTGGQAPAGGLTVGLISNNSDAATVPGTVVLQAGAKSATVTVTGIGAGSATIMATAANISPATAAVTVQPPLIGTVIVSSVSVGQNLQTAVAISIPQAVNVPVSLNVTSSDPSKMVVAARATDAGTQQTSVTIPAGGISIGVIVQGLAGSGTVNLTASAVGYNSGSGPVTLTPSGFVMTGPGGVSSITTNVGAASSTLTLNSVRLDSSFNFAEYQQVRGGPSVVVIVNNSTPGVGKATSSVTFVGAATQATAQFTPTTNSANTGTTTLTAIAPAGFGTPASGSTVTALVNSSSLAAANVTVGNNLQTTANVSIAGGAPSGAQIVVTSNQPSLFKVACLAGQPASICTGSGPITLMVQSGATVSPDFAVIGGASSGTGTYSATAAGFVMGTGTVTLAPSGFVISGPSGVGAASFVPFNATATISVFPALLDSALNYVAVQPLAAGMSVNVNVTSSVQAVGTVSPSVVTVTGGGAITTFTKGGGGDSVLAVNTPAGFSTPAQDTKVTAHVLTVSFDLSSCDGILIGQNLQTSCTANVNPAPVTDLTVTLTSNNPGQMLVSASDTVAGSGSITVTIPAGTTSASFTLQSLGDSGDVTFTASAANFLPRTGTATLAPSGVVISGPAGSGAQFFNATAGGATVPITVSIGPLDAFNGNRFAGAESVRAGFGPVQVFLNSGALNVGTIDSPVNIPGGADHTVAQFNPIGGGQATVSVAPPTGFTASANRTSLTGLVF